MARQLRADSVYRHFFDNDGLSMWAAVMLGPLSRTAPPSMMRCPPISAVSRSNQRVGSARPPGARRDIPIPCSLDELPCSDNKNSVLRSR